MVQEWQQLVAVRSPMLCLDERFRYPTSPSDPILHFGLAYSAENIIYCALKRQLLPPKYKEERASVDGEGTRLFIALMNVKKYLEEKLKIQLFLCPTINPGYLGTFALYSNHTRHRLQRPKKERVLNFIRRELDIRKQQAAWYWNANHGLEYVLNRVTEAIGIAHRC